MDSLILHGTPLHYRIGFPEFKPCFYMRRLFMFIT